MLRYQQVVGCILGVLLHATVSAQTDTDRLLIEQANFWHARADDVRAAEAWNKLLLSRPDHPEGLYGLALVELGAGRTDAAHAYLQRLRDAHPGHHRIAQLEQDIQLSSPQAKALLEEARQAIASADVDEAILKYQEALGGRTPVGKIGGDYYTFLGYTSDGLSEAINGLKRISAQMPDDKGVQLGLARHLARNEATRVEGIRRLANLADDPAVGSEATESWRDGLIWLGVPKAEHRGLFAEYLQRFPDDDEIREQSEQRATPAQHAAAVPARPDPLRRRTDAALQMLESGDAQTARQEFQAVLDRRPNDADALGGMGVLAMQDGNWQEALEYLSRARQRNSAWQAPLSVAQYWVDVDKAQSLHLQGQTAEARQLLDQAAKRQPDEVAANLLLADIALDDGQFAAAGKAYQSILQRYPHNSQALLGQSRALRQSGNENEARRLLEQALARDADNPWLRYELAQIYHDSGQEQEAQGLVEGLLLTHPDDPDVLFVSALMHANAQRWSRVLDALEQIAPARRTLAMNNLYASANRRVQIGEAVTMARTGDKARALAWLGQIEAGAPDDFETISAVARAYVDIGEPARGLALLRPLRAQGQTRSVDASIAYVGLLLASEQDVEAAVLLRDLQSQALSLSQRRQVRELADTYRIRQADTLTGRGELAAAYDMLAPVLDRRRNDPAAQGSLARMYMAAGEKDKATDIYDSLLRADPENPDIHLGLAQLGQQSRNYRQAQRHADIAVSLAPEDTNVLVAAARILRASGKSRDAARLLEQAIALNSRESNEDVEAIAVASAGGARPLASENPFAGLPGQRRRSVTDTKPLSPLAMMPPTPQGQRPVTASTSATRQAVPPADAGALPADLLHRDDIPSPATAVTPDAPRSIEHHHDQRHALSSSRAASDDIPEPQNGREAPFVASSEGVALTGLASELDEIYQERSVRISMGTEVRSRDGDKGTSRLTEVQAPIEIDFPVGNDRMSARITPVTLSAGSANAQPGATGPVDLIGLDPLRVDSGRERGVGLSLEYRTRGMTFDAGVTPLGFQETNFTGGAMFEGALDNAGTMSYRLDVSRRPVTDSMLSYAGRRYDDLGLEWGGVMATGARMTLSKDFGGAGLYGSAAWHRLSGHNVASNHRTELNAGTYFSIIDTPDTKLTAGINLNATYFNKNLGHFTYGHGGYFSPKHYYAFGVPFTWAQRAGRFSYRLDGAIGVQHFKQDDAEVFPNSSALQAYAVQMAGQNSLFGDGYYRGDRKTGVSYNVKAAAEYRLDPQLVFGVTVGADNADDYQQWMGGLYMRYYFHPQRSLLDIPVEPYRSPYGITYGR